MGLVTWRRQSRAGIFLSQEKIKFDMPGDSDAVDTVGRDNVFKDWWADFAL